MNAFFVFGMILFVICLVVYPSLQKEEVVGGCIERSNIADNKKYFRVFFITSLVMIVFGIFGMLF